VAAFVLPALIVVTGLAAPLGLPSPGVLSYERVSAFAASLPGAAFLFVVISLSLWHGFHRIYHSLHELGVHRGLSVVRVLCYGTALAGTALTAYLLVTAI
jgi:fumarate reductase subunit D